MELRTFSAVNRVSCNREDLYNPSNESVNSESRKAQGLAWRTLVALYGTEHFCSQTLSCPQCRTRKRTNGKTEHYQAVLSAMVVASMHNIVLRPMPEFIAPQDGAKK